MKIVEKYLLIFLLLLLPTQLAYHFWPSWAYVFGLRIDFLAPAIYLTDILILLLVSINLKLFKSCLKYLAIFAVFVSFNTLFSTSLAETLYRWIKVLEFAAFGLYVSKQKALEINQTIKYLFYSATCFSVIGIIQYLKGATLGGIFYWFGERSFNMGTPGIALVSLNGVEHLRSYSTFAHPNSLAGYLGVILMVVLLSGGLKKTWFNLLCFVVNLICFTLTFSASATLGLFLIVILYMLSKKFNSFNSVVLIAFFSFILLSLILPTVSPWIIRNFSNTPENISQRLDLAVISGKMISNRFVTGVGIGAFITNIPNHKGIASVAWLLQPVHNIFLLVFVEIGIFGLVVFCLLLFKLIKILLLKKNYAVLLSSIFIIFTGLFDHYWLTLQQNQLLLSLLIGLTFR